VADIIRCPGGVRKPTNKLISCNALLATLVISKEVLPVPLRCIEDAFGDLVVRRVFEANRLDALAVERQEACPWEGQDYWRVRSNNELDAPGTNKPGHLR
jgi:hypothetical protein